MPKIAVRCRPASGYGRQAARCKHGSNHMRFYFGESSLRLTSNVPMAYLWGEVPFVLEDPIYMILGPDESLTRPIADVAREFLENTTDHWYGFVRHLAVPFEWQTAVIRAAITLKLCAVEDTGALVAALTTSIPEYPDSGRNWDYRFCWLRDSFFSINALNRLGATNTMQKFMSYITNIISSAPVIEDDVWLQPLYGISLETEIDEEIVTTLDGYRKMGPVRVGNAAYTQVQNDVFGAVVLSAAQVFFDERFEYKGRKVLFEKLEALGETAYKVYDKPDAGIWELREIESTHTFSAVMCWAACDRLASIATKMEEEEKSTYWQEKATEMHKKIMDEAWNEELGTFVESFGGGDVDAVLLLLPDLGFIEAMDDKFVSTVNEIEKQLKVGNQIKRYAIQDDFGFQHNGFTVCTFWFIQALHGVGRVDEARELFEDILQCANHVGIFSEDLDPETFEHWGNTPQTYSMVGLILCALRLSKPWRC
eukprot:TRINITY_DN2576_c0_g1_i3.p1 TRINITY_DN2576_c0_g1~~TRINITY_DN2576_c0_g1_i3.p1  ORF type:complete len:481 (+),score=164.57 TRINITY_DN2576_c0_g1_i3:258-1700(+)